MSVRSGQDYLNKMNHLKSEIWLDGKKVEGNLTDHPVFSRILGSQASLYDLQLKKSDKLTFISPKTGEKVGLSFLEPKTKEDLEKRRLMITEWAKTSGGMLGRSPDYMNTALMAFNSASEVLQKSPYPFAQNLRTLYENACANDLSFTNTFINPQVNRAQFHVEDPDTIISAQTVSHNGDGIIVKGARHLATQGGLTDEILVFPTNASAWNKEFAYAFSIPSNTPGLKFLCRESFSYRSSEFDHPLGARFDEIDAIVVFDNVFIPWERVFCYQDSKAAFEIYNSSSFTPLTAHQITTRRVVKTEFILGLAQMLVETINIGEYQHIHEKMAEIIIGLETLKALLLSSELNAKIDRWGTMVPDFGPLGTASLMYTRFYPRICEVLQLIGASGLVTIPSEADFSSNIRTDLDIYLQAANANAFDRVRIFRLAWDVSMSAFGTRQALYERFFLGDPVKLTSGFYQSYDKSQAVQLVTDFLKE